MNQLLNEIDLTELTKQYQEAKPFKHVVIDNFFKLDVANRLADEFPDYNDDNLWSIYRNPLEKKRTNCNWEKFPALTYKTFTELNDRFFVNYIESIIDVPNVIPDMGLHGGGWHMTPPGGKLNVHLDYSIHPKLRLERRVNLIIYLSHWQKEWGGELELWSHDWKTNAPKECVTTVDIKFNRAILFDTTQNSWHGLPNPVKSPEGVYRKSLNIYYLTEPRKEATDRERALFAPYKEQKDDENILELIKKRSNSNTTQEAYRTENE